MGAAENVRWRLILEARAARSRHRIAAAGAALLLASVAHVPTFAASPAAHEMASRFSAEAAAQPAAKPAAQPAAKPATKPGKTADNKDQLKAYEDEMLARARAEAEARTKADLAAEEEAARRRQAAEQERLRTEKDAESKRAEAVEAARKAEEARLAAERETETRRLSERLRATREERRAKLAREASDKANADAKAAAEAQARTEAEARVEARRREEARVEALAKAEAQAKADAVAKSAAASEQAQREAAMRANAETEHARAVMRERARHLAEKIEAYRAANPPAVPAETLAAKPAAITATQPTTEVAAIAPAAADANTARDDTVTVLLIMNAGNRGIRRWNKSADPMLCVGGSCYISRGSDEAAESMSRSKGFGPGVALGKRAGACSNHLGCVFRGVSLGGPREWMQPIDLRIMRHDRREAKLVSADQTCVVESGRLSCNGEVVSDDYRAWIVPERIARQAGSAALEAALGDELASRHAASDRR